MRLQMCLALGLLAGAAMAQDGYWNRRDQQWQRHEDRQIDRDLARLDRAHDWVLDHGRYRYWERDHWVYEPGFVDLAVPGFAVYEGRSVFDLNVEIGNLNVELTTLRHGPWYRDRDIRIEELRARIARDKDRIHWLRHHE